MVDVTNPPGAVFTATNITNANGGDVQEFIDAPYIDIDAANGFPIRQADGTVVQKFDTRDAYASVGTATLGAPRIFYGTNAPSGDDSAICVGRGLVGALLFSHAFRDESTFLSTGDSAYTAFDARHTYLSNGGLKYNHGYGGQASHEMAAANGMDLFAGFVTNMRVSAGTVDRLFHFHVQGVTISGTGAVTQHVGFYCGPLSGGAGVNFGIYVENNPCFFGDYVQLNGDDVIGFRQVKGGSGNFNGGLTEFVASGGIVISGNGGGSDYAVIRSYLNAGGATKGLALNPTGGQVIIGSPTPINGGALEVVGDIKASTKIAAVQGLGVGNSANATTPGTVTKKIEIFDVAGASLGFIAVYDAIT